MGRLLSFFACAAILGAGAFTGVFGQTAGEPVAREQDRLTVNATSTIAELGYGPKPEWWGGACTIDPYGWGGWDERSAEVFMHVLDVPTDDYPNIRFGFLQHLYAGEIRYKEVYVMVAKDPTDFLIDGKWMRWKVRVDTGYAWRYLGYWHDPYGFDAVVVERELPGLVEFCQGDQDGKIWVVLQFDRAGIYLMYWSQYEFCPRTWTYGVQTLEWGRVTKITRWPVPYQAPPCYVLWTSMGHRIW